MGNVFWFNYLLKYRTSKIKFIRYAESMKHNTVCYDFPQWSKKENQLTSEELRDLEVAKILKLSVSRC